MNAFQKFMNDYHAHLPAGVVMKDIDRNDASEREGLAKIVVKWKKEQDPSKPSEFLNLGNSEDEGISTLMYLLMFVNERYPCDEYGWIAGSFYDHEDAPGRWQIFTMNGNRILI